MQKAHTFTHGQRQTLIDYVITRRTQAIGKAKQSKPVHDDSLTGWRESKRYPVFAQFSHKIRHDNHSQQVSSKRYDLLKILSQDKTQADFRAQAARVSEIADSISLQTYSRLPAALRDICDQKFGMRREKQQPRWCDEGVKNKVGSMWYSYRCSKGLEHTTAWSSGHTRSASEVPDLIGQIFFRWRSRCSFLQAQKVTRKHGRELKKQRFLDILQEAKTAIQNNNQHGLFRVVRSLAPKQKHSAMQVYGPREERVSRQQEIDILKQHVSGVWKSPPDWYPPMLHTKPESHGEQCFRAPSVQEVCHAVETIRAPSSTKQATTSGNMEATRQHHWTSCAQDH